MSTPAHLFGLRRSIKVMAAGQTIARQEKNSFKNGWERLHPRYHALLTLEELEKRLKSMQGTKTDAQRWQKFVPEDFVDQRGEFIAGHAERMRVFNKSDTSMKAFVRAHNLAYAFLRHKPYRSVEQKAYTPPQLDMVFQVILQNHPDHDFPSQAKKALADWLLDHSEEIPEDDWQYSGTARYKLRNMSQGKHPLEGTPKYEEMKAAKIAAAKESAKADDTGQAQA
jgi:hypothetical protein